MMILDVVYRDRTCMYMFFLCIKVFLYIQRFMHMCIFIFVYIHTYKYTYFLSTYVCCVYCVSSICLFPGYGYVFCQGKDYRLVSPSALESTPFGFLKENEQWPICAVLFAWREGDPIVFIFVCKFFSSSAVVEGGQDLGRHTHEFGKLLLPPRSDKEKHTHTHISPTSLLLHLGHLETKYH